MRASWSTSVTLGTFFGVAVAVAMATLLDVDETDSVFEPVKVSEAEESVDVSVDDSVEDDSDSLEVSVDEDDSVAVDDSDSVVEDSEEDSVEDSDSVVELSVADELSELSVEEDSVVDSVSDSEEDDSIELENVVAEVIVVLDADSETALTTGLLICFAPKNWRPPRGPAMADWATAATAKARRVLDLMIAIEGSKS